MAINIGNNKEKYTSLEEKKLDLDAGWLGKLFGNEINAPSNIAGVSIVVLLAVSIYGTAYPPEKLEVTELWKITTPIITMILGYLFGKNKNS